jgi:putative flippase GtrA
MADGPSGWLRSLLRLKLLRFLMVGLANTALGLSVIYFAKLVLRLDDVVANAMGYALGLLASYALNSAWTFDYRGRNVTAIGKFLAAFLISYGVNLLTVWCLIQASVNSYVAQAAGIPPYTLCFYLLCRLIVFRDKRHGPHTAPQMPS